MKRGEEKRLARHRRVRRKIIGTKEKPRLSVYRSLKHFYAQLIDDIGQKTLLSVSTLKKPFCEKAKAKKGTDAATEFGRFFAAEAKSKGHRLVVFDRGGYLYHGRVKAFAEACREGGLLF